MVNAKLPKVTLNRKVMLQNSAIRINFVDRLNQSFVFYRHDIAGSWVFGRSGMKNFLRVMQTTLRAALWRSTAVERSISVFTVLVFATLAMASEAARQYLDGRWSGGLQPSMASIRSSLRWRFSLRSLRCLFRKDRAVVLAQLAGAGYASGMDADRGQPRTVACISIRCRVSGLIGTRAVLVTTHRAGMVDRRGCHRIPRRRHRALSEPGAAGLLAVCGGRSSDRRAAGISDISRPRFSISHPTISGSGATQNCPSFQRDDSLQST